MVADSGAVARAPPAPPPRLNPVRVRIEEEPVAARTQDFREILHAYSKEEAILEAKRCIQCRRPWCVEACPITQDCREYIRLIAAGEWDQAARVTAQDNPLATCLCKVCYHYCEDACVVKKKGVPIAIRHLKRAALDYGTPDLVYVPSKPVGQRVAVIGGGPAGLMAAWELGVRGYGVTVYEQDQLVGGLMRTIPAYRMTDADINVDKARFKNLDVTFVPATKVGRDLAPQALLADGYQAVLVSIGTPDHRRLNIPGEDLDGVHPAIGLLRAISNGEKVALGKKVVVVGGGDVAMDSIRSAVRLSGGDVTLVYRRGRQEMPADPDEVHGAEQEGVHFVFQKTPCRILGNGHVQGIELESIELGPPDASGRRSPVVVPNSQQTIPCDTVIVAVGQKADLTGFDQGYDFRITGQGWAEGKGDGYATAVPGVFATGGRSVVYAMGAATKAADAIDLYLCKKRGAAPAPRPDAFGGDVPFHLPAGYTSPIRV
jgi:NADPH-dependent glutamate synthase beta subunit-like oxidoreductase